MKARSCARCRRTFTGGVFVGPLGEQCPVCLSFLEQDKRAIRWSLLFDLGVIIAAALAGALVCLLLTGCS